MLACRPAAPARFPIPSGPRLCGRMPCNTWRRCRHGRVPAKRSGGSSSTGSRCFGALAGDRVQGLGCVGPHAVQNPAALQAWPGTRQAQRRQQQHRQPLLRGASWSQGSGFRTLGVAGGRCTWRRCGHGRLPAERSGSSSSTGSRCLGALRSGFRVWGVGLAATWCCTWWCSRHGRILSKGSSTGSRCIRQGAEFRVHGSGCGAGRLVGL